MKKKTGMFQQGDVTMLYIDKLPDGCKKVKPRNGQLVLAEGEATGHMHAIAAVDGVDLFREEDGTLYLVIEKGVTTPPLTHQEHGPQTREPGVIEIGRVVEVDPWEKAIREVAD